ncbi:MAG: fenitrothion hydrolase [Actinomycetota bacterium]|nr:fenitrothion hydrolase [Actinomycetota bacterium]
MRRAVNFARHPDRAGVNFLATPIALAVFPEPALAHGLGGRADLPIPAWLFGWAAATVLVVSFVALAALWTKPKLEGDSWRPLPGGVGRGLASRPVEVVCGAVGVALLLLVVWSGAAGSQVTTENLAPTFVYVAFWVALVPVSVVFGDVFRAFNPWRAAGRAIGWAASKAAGEPLTAPLRYPERLGRWPAVAGLLAFTWLELAAQDGDLPRNVALAALVYSLLTGVAMALYGVDAWIGRGEAFSVYFNLFSRISPFERRGREVGVRRPLSGLTSFDPRLSGTVALLAVAIGGVSFDGASEGALWAGVVPELIDFFESLGLARGGAVEAASTVGLLATVALVYGLYRIGVAGARTVGGGFTTDRLARAFAHSLVPIALVYVAAHYLTLLVFQGQALIPLLSDPLGGADRLGAAGGVIDYGVIDATAVWYIQVGLVVVGHVAALTWRTTGRSCSTTGPSWPWALQPIPEITVVGPSIAAQA